MIVLLQRAAGDDAVQVDVLGQVLAPGVEQRGDPERSAQMAPITAEAQQRLRSGAEQEVVDESRVALRQGVEIVR